MFERVAEGYTSDPHGFCGSFRLFCHVCKATSKNDLVFKVYKEKKASLGRVAFVFVGLEFLFGFIWNLKSSFEISKFNLKLNYFHPVWKFISNMDPTVQCECITPHHVINLNTCTWHHSLGSISFLNFHCVSRSLSHKYFFVPNNRGGTLICFQKNLNNIFSPIECRIFPTNFNFSPINRAVNINNISH